MHVVILPSTINFYFNTNYLRSLIEFAVQFVIGGVKFVVSL